ncbi:MAG: hypothetical protein BMS9Abin22_645 [Gammaproteobacteria bacterium]|nr:MAG: hypothetical protein BMS9Abin22_645 [Gammaproteobacteria bacterium]
MKTGHSQKPEKAEQRLLIRDRDAIRDHIAVLIEQARREIAVFAPRFDSHFFNTARFAEALATFVVRHRHNQARLLVEDAQQLVQDNGRLIGLSRRLSDFIHIRQVGEEHTGMRDMFILADQNGYLHQQDVERHECLVDFNGRSKAMALASRFEEMWVHGVLVPAIRTVGL